MFVILSLLLALEFRLDVGHVSEGDDIEQVVELVKTLPVLGNLRVQELDGFHHKAGAE